MEENVATRLKLFIDTNGLSSTQFADMCGIPRPTLSQILSGRNKKISDILVGQIHRAFPDLSVVWLLFGEGPVKVNAARPFASVVPHPASESLSELAGSDLSGNVSDSNNEGNAFRNGNDAGADVSTGVYNQESRNGAGQDKNNSILRGFNQVGNSTNSSENQIFESDLKIMDLTRQIDQLRQNPRRVLQITIYYDDSTFETFVPK